MARYIENQAYKGLKNVSPQNYGSAFGTLPSGWCVVVEAERADRILEGASPTLEYMDQAEVDMIVSAGVPALYEPFDPAGVWGTSEAVINETMAQAEVTTDPPEVSESSEGSSDGSEDGSSVSEPESEPVVTPEPEPVVTPESEPVVEETKPEEVAESPVTEPTAEVSPEAPTTDSSTSSEPTPAATIEDRKVGRRFQKREG